VLTATQHRQTIRCWNSDNDAQRATSAWLTTRTTIARAKPPRWFAYAVSNRRQWLHHSGFTIFSSSYVTAQNGTGYLASQQAKQPRMAGGRQYLAQHTVSALYPISPQSLPRHRLPSAPGAVTSAPSSPHLLNSPVAKKRAAAGVVTEDIPRTAWPPDHHHRTEKTDGVGGRTRPVQTNWRRRQYLTIRLTTARHGMGAGTA